MFSSYAKVLNLVNSAHTDIIKSTLVLQRCSYLVPRTVALARDDGLNFKFFDWDVETMKIFSHSVNASGTFCSEVATKSELLSEQTLNKPRGLKDVPCRRGGKNFEFAVVTSSDWTGCRAYDIPEPIGSGPAHIFPHSPRLKRSSPQNTSRPESSPEERISLIGDGHRILI